MPSVLRSLAPFAFVSALVALSLPGCSQQDEGERCDSAKNGNADCSSGLTCVPASKLIDQTADRCCPSGTPDDSRCTLKVLGGSTTGGSGGTAGTAGTAGTGDTGGVGEAGGAGGDAPSSAVGGAMLDAAGSPSVVGGASSGGSPSEAGAPASGGAG